MNWTLLRVHKLMDMVESPSSSVDDLESCVAKVNGKLPTYREMRNAGYRERSSVFLAACLEDKAAYREKIDFFESKGGFIGDIDDSFRCTKTPPTPPADYREINPSPRLITDMPDGSIVDTPAELQFAKEVLEFLIGKGWRIFNRGDVELTLCYAYHDDVPFLRRLRASGGLRFSLHNNHAWANYELVRFLMHHCAYDALDFLVESRMPLRYCHVGSVGPEFPGHGDVPAWRPGHVDYLLSKGVSLAFDEFSANCDLDMYRYAFQKLGSKNLRITRREMERLPSMWGNVFHRQRFDIGDYLLRQGVPRPRGTVDLRDASRAAIDWGLSRGFKLRIHVQNDKDLLLYAAKRGLEPCGRAAVNVVTHKLDGLQFARDEWHEGMQALCETLDEEVVTAFLDAGFGEGVDTSTAIEWGCEGLLESYRRHGIDVVPKRVTRGALYVHGQAAVIPEGVEEVGVGACSNWELQSVQLPSTLKRIGSEAFTRLDYGRPPASVVVPPSVEHVGKGAFAGWQQITVYDTLDKDSAGAGEKIDVSTGQRNGDAGWMALRAEHDRLGNSQHASWAQLTTSNDHQVIVRSAETGEVKYRVDMPLESATQNVRHVFVSAWGRNATFHFPALDAMFERLPNRQAKVRAAINRLLWPVSLEPEVAEIYEAYLRRSAKAAVRVAAAMDDLDGLGLLDGMGLVKPTNVEEGIKAARDAEAKEAEGFLRACKAERFPSTGAASAKGPAASRRAAKPKKPVRQ